MIVAFEITEDDRRQGVANEECRCAAARAICRKLPGREVKVWYEQVCIDDVSIDSPPVLRDFVAQYDEEPGWQGQGEIIFELDVPAVSA